MEDEDDDGVVAVSLELLPEADGEDDEDDGVLDVPLELLPVADGDDLDGSDDEEDDCATARDDSANNTAAAVILRVFGMDLTSGEWVVDLRRFMCKRCAQGGVPTVVAHTPTLRWQFA